MGELKSCPFCGNTPYTRLSVVRATANDYIMYKVRCGECGIEMSDSVGSGDSFEDLATVVEKVNNSWNNRTPRESTVTKDLYDLGKAETEEESKLGFWKLSGQSREYRWFACSDCSRVICDTTEDGMEYGFCPYCGKPKSNPNG